VASFVRGEVVVVPFPFSSEEDFKRRPAVIVTSWPFEHGEDYLLCLITSQPIYDPYFMPLQDSDMADGSLDRISYIRPSYLFTANEAMIMRRIGALKPDKMQEVLETIRQLFD
jgi:mRNA interferase MazF